jgi:hypothetical protein
VPTGIQRTGLISLSRAEGKVPVGTGPPVEFVEDSLGAGFQQADYTNYVPPPPSTAQVTRIGPCSVLVVTPQPGTPQPGNYTPPVITPLDAGPVLNVTGPNGTKQAKQLMSFTPGMGPTAYSAALGGDIPLPPTPFPIPGLDGPTPLWLDPGAYTVDNGSGGADFGPFTATVTLPAPFVWTNADADMTVTLAAGVDIQWTGGDPAATVLVAGVSAANGTVGAFNCLVPNTGEFMITPDVLSPLPATVGTPSLGTSTLTVSTGGSTNFSAPGLDAAFFNYGYGYSRTVTYQ